jgi:hypothetical protein
MIRRQWTLVCDALIHRFVYHCSERCILRVLQNHDCHQPARDRATACGLLNMCPAPARHTGFFPLAGFFLPPPAFVRSLASLQPFLSSSTQVFFSFSRTCTVPRVSNRVSNHLFCHGNLARRRHPLYFALSRVSST